MNRLAPVLALLLASASSATAAAATTTIGASGSIQPSESGSTARRFTGGASAEFTVSVRIIHAPAAASVGEGLGPPAPLMTARETTVGAADGSPVPALVYDFE